MSSPAENEEQRPFVLGLDLDGVCGDYIHALREILAKKRGVDEESLTKEVTWNFPEWDLTPEQYLELHKEAVNEHNIFFTMPTIEGASEALWELSNNGVWIRVITHRLIIHWGHKTAAQDTVAWLDKNDIPYREICFVGAKTEVGADAYIDDSPTNIDALRGKEREVIIFEQHYNKDLPAPRAKNWDEALKIIQDMVLKTKGSLPAQLPGIGFESSPLQERLSQRSK